MVSFSEVEEFITVWITEDYHKHTHFITNFGRESKWQAVDKLLEVMNDNNVIAVRTFKNLKDGTTVEGDLLGALKIQLNKNIKHPKPDQEVMLRIIKENEHKVVR